MPDPITRLEDLGRATAPVTPPPPQAVRRRGDHLRRRRTAAVSLGAAAAVAVVAVGGTLLVGGPDAAPPLPPADSPSGESSPTPPPESGTPPTRIPAGFPLDAGLAGAVVSGAAGMAALDYCGTTPLAGLEPVDVRTAGAHGGETAITRTLYLLESPRAAQAARTALTEAARDCSKSGADGRDSGDVVVHAAVDSWPGSTITEDFAHGAATTEPSVEVVHAVDRGAALLVTSTFGSWSGDLDTGVAQTREEIRPVVEAMAVFGDAGEPSGEPADPPATELPEGSDIPAGFPLDLDHLDLTGDGGELLGPGPEVRGLEDEQVCAAGLWKLPGTDRLAFVSTGPEYSDVRELRTFATADDAAAQMAQLRSSFAGCDREVRDGTTIVWTTYEEDTGYDSFTFSATVEGSLGGGVFQVTRVGRAVLAMAVGAEWSPETAPDGARDLTAVTRQVAAEMCLFTEAGC